MRIVKNKFYTFLVIGAGLVFATTYSYAKPTHIPKKHTVASGKHGKQKSGLKHIRNHVQVKPKLLKTRRHATKQKNWDEFSAKNFPEFETTNLEKNLASAPVMIPHLPSSNPIAKLDANKSRVHSVVGGRSQINDTNVLETSPHHFNSAHGVISSSLAEAAQDAGLSEDLTIQLTNIFAWDIDFATNLQSGDQFTVVYENNLDGERIVAAEFVSGRQILTAVRYEDSEGNVNYYTPEGKAMRKAFLSSPVDYARISSRFNANRRHPILNRIRAHKGTDYAARTGTPVKAAGDGSIAFLGRKGGYGQVAIIKHGERYETVYAHLAGFKRGLLEGDNVHQGEIIGYVGQTGLATGPHLHYEFRVDGVHRNPEIALSHSRHEMALNDVLLDDFKAQAQPLLAQLYHAKAQTMLVKNQRQTN